MVSHPFWRVHQMRSPKFNKIWKDTWIERFFLVKQIIKKNYIYLIIGF